MPTRFTLNDVVDFCWANKRKRAFKGYTYEEVCRIVIYAANNGLLKTVEDDQGICGAAIFKAADKKVFVDFLVAVRGGFATFVDYYKREFPDHKLAAYRDNKLVTINSRILCQQLQKS